MQTELSIYLTYTLIEYGTQKTKQVACISLALHFSLHPGIYDVLSSLLWVFFAVDLPNI